MGCLTVLATTLRVLKVLSSENMTFPHCSLVQSMYFLANCILFFFILSVIHGSLPAGQLQVHLQAPLDGPHGHGTQETGQLLLQLFSCDGWGLQDSPQHGCGCSLACFPGPSRASLSDRKLIIRKVAILLDDSLDGPYGDAYCIDSEMALVLVFSFHKVIIFNFSVVVTAFLPMVLESEKFL
jgi:hypothetical protein